MECMQLEQPRGFGTVDAVGVIATVGDDRPVDSAVPNAPRLVAERIERQFATWFLEFIRVEQQPNARRVLRIEFEIVPWPGTNETPSGYGCPSTVAQARARSPAVADEGEIMSKMLCK